MTDTYTADWYDLMMVASDSPAMLPLEASPWLTVYERLAAMIEPHEEVVDLGCGTGRFIELLQRQKHYARITGIDWSAAALTEAETYAGTMPTFQQQDLADWEPNLDRAGNTVYVCSEVLEHLDDDVDLVRRIPPGHRLLFTVPNFQSKSHLRVFVGAGDLWERYSGWLLFRSWRLVGTERKGIHVVESSRRSDAW